MQTQLPSPSAVVRRAEHATSPHRIGILNDYVRVPFANGSSFASQFLFREFVAQRSRRERHAARGQIDGFRVWIARPDHGHVVPARDELAKQKLGSERGAIRERHAHVVVEDADAMWAGRVLRPMNDGGRRGELCLHVEPFD